MTFPIPAAALAQHIIALGKTGAGKSSKLRVIVEHLLEDAQPVCIIDPKGDWYGLRMSGDGKRAGFPVVIFGGEHADVPINEHSGAHVAELLATGNRSAIIDLGGWMVGERTRFLIDFLSHYFRLARGKRYLLPDEVHNIAPQGKILDPNAGKLLHWANRIASEGRGKGITVIAASQRPQKVHKDFITSCETLIACKVIHKLDRDAIKDWIDGCADPAAGRQVLAQLAGLKKPEAFVWSPEIEFGPQLVTFPMFRTFDSFKPREHGEEAELTGWASVDLDDVKSKLAAAVQEAEENDPKALRARIAELEKAATSAPGKINIGTHTAADIVEARRTGERSGYESAIEEFREQIAGVLLAVAQTASTIAGEMERLEAAIEKETSRAQIPVTGNSHQRLPTEPAAGGGHARGMRSPEDHSRAAAATPVKPGAAGSSSIGNSGKRRILVALAQKGGGAGLAVRKLSLLTGISQKGGTWRTYMAELRGRGWIDGRDTIRITAAGVQALGRYEPLPTGPALIDYWRDRLGNSGKRAIFDVLVAAYPRQVPGRTVAERTSIAIDGGTWRTYLAELRGLELVEGRSELRAAAELFE